MSVRYTHRKQTNAQPIGKSHRTLDGARSAYIQPIFNYNTTTSKRLPPAGPRDIWSKMSAWRAHLFILKKRVKLFTAILSKKRQALRTN